MLGQDYILDASAVLAVLFAEEGADRVIELADLSFITGVTVAEGYHEAAPEGRPGSRSGTCRTAD